MGKHRIRSTRDFIRFVTCLKMVCGAQIFKENITLVLRTCKPAFFYFFSNRRKKLFTLPSLALVGFTHSLCPVQSVSPKRIYTLYICD